MITGQLARELLELVTDINSWIIALQDKQPSKMLMTLEALDHGLHLIEPYIGEEIRSPSYNGILVGGRGSTRFKE